MITKFFARNLGLFPEISVDLNPLTVVVGKNASGKSTILRGIAVLARLVRTPIYPAKRGGGKSPLRVAPYVHLSDLFGTEKEELSLGVETKSLKGSGSYSIALAMNAVTGRLEVTDEKASWKGVGGESFSFDAKNTDLEFEYRGQSVPATLPRESTLPFLARSFFEQDAHWGRKLKPLYELQETFSPFLVYRFSPASIALPSDPGGFVGFDGRGLPAELDRLLGSRREVFDAIEEDLRKTFPHVAKINIDTLKPREGKALKALRIEMAGGASIPAQLESDGVLTTLAYLWLCHTGPAGFGAEEPETGGYPTLIRDRIRLLRGVAETGTQVMLTSHSPVLLMAVGDPREVLVCDTDGVSGRPIVFSTPETDMMDLIYRRLEWSV